MSSHDTTLTLEQALHLAVEHHAAGRLEQAEPLFQAIVEALPDHADTLHHLGLIAWQKHEHAKALQLLERAIALAPERHMFRNGHGLVLRHLGRLEEAAATLQLLLQHQPECAEAAVNLGHTLYDMCDVPGAEAAYRQALAHKEIAGARVRLAVMAEPIPTSEAMIHRRRATMLRRIQTLIDDGIILTDPIMEVGMVPFYNAYHGENDRQIQQLLARFYLGACPSLGWRRPDLDQPREPAARIRIGFVSAYLCDHTIGKLKVGLIEELDRTRFEVLVFHVGGKADRDTLSRRINAAADRVVELPHALEAARLAIAAQQPDILYFTDIGMESFTWFLGLARLAPVQCVTWGHPVTTGSPHMDYYLSSECLELPGAEEHYSETLIKLKSGIFYLQPPKRPERLPSRASLGLPETGRLYLCPQSPFKIHPSFDAVIGEILRQDPEGHLVLLHQKNSFHKAQILARFGAAFPDVAQRVRFCDWLETSQFHGLLMLADAVLDTPHFSGGFSSHEALGLGVPVVTWPCTYERSRFTHGCYVMMEMTALSASNAEQYVAMALRLAQDTAWHEEMKRMIEKRSHRLFGNRALVGEIGDVLYETLHKGKRVR